jgi:hypothetical protein
VARAREVDFDELVVEVGGLAYTSSSARRWAAMAEAASAISARLVLRK